MIDSAAIITYALTATTDAKHAGAQHASDVYTSISIASATCFTMCNPKLNVAKLLGVLTS